MKNSTFIALLIIFTLSKGAWAGGSSPDTLVSCEFEVPLVHSLQQDGPYKGKGPTAVSARGEALEACKKDLDRRDRVPGACDRFSSNENNWNCESNFDNQ